MDISKYFVSSPFIILFLISLAGIFLVLYLMRIYIPLIFSGKINTNRFRKYFAIFQGVVWSLFLLTTALFFLKHNIIFAALLFLVLLLFIYWYSRYSLRDYIAGLVFKSENRFSLNEIVEVEGQKGEIKKFHYRNIEIENESGKRILIPYSMLLGLISSPQKISETVLHSSFETEIPSIQPFVKVVEQLKIFIYSLPWTALKNEPKIQLINEIENKYLVRITLFSFDDTYFPSMHKRVEEFIKHNFQEAS